MSNFTTAKARELLAHITPGDWELVGGGEYVTPVGILVAPDDGGISTPNAEFIAAAPRLMRALLAENERLWDNLANRDASSVTKTLRSHSTGRRER